MLRWALSTHGVPTWGELDWQKANIPFSTALFAYLHHVLTKHGPQATVHSPKSQIENRPFSF